LSKSTNHQRDFRPWLLLLSVIIIALDRVTKIWVTKHIEIGSAITVIPRVFRISHVTNNGAAFSMFADSLSPQRVRWMLIAFSVVAIVAVIAFLLRMGRRLSPTAVALAMVLAGALGNLYDRICFASVVDFLEVHIGTYHWPDFNVADSAIVIGGCLLLLDAFRAEPASVDEPG
jgi:signal peptidase II